MFGLLIRCRHTPAGRELKGVLGALMVLLASSALAAPVSRAGEAGAAFGLEGDLDLELGVYEPCASPGDCDVREGLQRIAEAGGNAVLVTVVDGGMALYPSKVLPMADYADPDYVASVIREAHRLGLRVYAWVNIPHEHWLGEHPDWIAVLSDGRPADFYEGDYFHRIVSPARLIREPECVSTLRALFREIAAMGFDGVDVNDNFQFSDQYLEAQDTTLLTSYDEFTVRAFEEDTGIHVPGSGPREWASFLESNEEAWETWVRWRARQVTRLIEIIAGAVHDVDPDIPVRPHLLIWDPLATYGLDYAALAEATGTGTLYVMVPSEESRAWHVRAVAQARRAGARVVVASTYLYGISDSDDPVGEARRRGMWLAETGADGVYVHWFGEAEDLDLWDAVRAVFHGFREVKSARERFAWLYGTRAVSLWMSPEEAADADIPSIVGGLAAQGVSLIELDVGLSSYHRLYDEDGFREALQVVEEVTREAHRRGLKVTVYIPALEVVSDATLGRTLGADHRGWVQRGLDGTPLLATGRELDVVWVEPDEEDAWVSPASPHRQVIVDRARRLVEDGGADAIWLDVPHMPSYLTEELSDLWPDASEWGVESFEELYWEDPPSEPDWDDPVFRRWLAWRHEITLDFVLEVAEAVFEAGGVLMVETSANDASGNEVGFDPTLLRWCPIVALVPEVEPPAWGDQVRAGVRAWSDYLAMLKHARSCSPDRPVVPLTYGVDVRNAARQLALILSTADGFFETNFDGYMVGTVGLGFRKRAFRLVELLSGPRESEARVAVLFSRASRDYVDGYVNDPYDVSGTIHMAAFRGVIEALVRAGVQFDVVSVEELSPQELANYEVVIAPEVRCLGDGARRALRDYEGILLVIGKLGTMNELGDTAEPLEVGTRVTLEDLPGLLAEYASRVEAPEGVMVEEFSIPGCRLASIVATEDLGAGGELRVPTGSWVLSLDSWTAWPSDGVERAPDSAALVILEASRGDGEVNLERAVVRAPSTVDSALNPEAARLSGAEPPSTVIALGGPQVYPHGWDGAEVEFLRDRGAYYALRYPNGTLEASFGSEDYAVVWVTRCGGISLVRVAGITRFGTRAALLWLLSRGEVKGEYTILRWVDDGDGVVELPEVEVVVSW